MIVQLRTDVCLELGSISEDIESEQMLNLFLNRDEMSYQELGYSRLRNVRNQGCVLGFGCEHLVK